MMIITKALSISYDLHILRIFKTTNNFRPAQQLLPSFSTVISRPLAPPPYSNVPRIP